MRLSPLATLLALAACRATSDSAPARLSEASGLERVSLLSKGLE